MVDVYRVLDKESGEHARPVRGVKGLPLLFPIHIDRIWKDMEPGIPHKREHMLGVFQRLSEQIGADRVVWRYDPILFNHLYTPEYHLKAFEEIAGSLNGYTHKAVISFVDFYAKAKGRMKELALRAPSEEEAISFARKLAEIAGKNNMSAEACAGADGSAKGRRESRKLH